MLHDLTNQYTASLLCDWAVHRGLSCEYSVQLYIAPGLAIFGDIHHDPWNNFRLYGTAFMLVLTFIVAVGVKFVQLFAPISLACVIISFISILIGAVLANPETNNIW
jgi:hypothetical protein